MARWWTLLVTAAVCLLTARAALAAPPVLLTAFSVDEAHVLVKFDVPVTPASATHAANYALASLGSVDQATLVASGLVLLTVTTSLTPGDLEVLTVAGIADSLSGSPMPTPQALSFHFGVVTVHDIQTPDTGALADSCADRSRFAGSGEEPGDPVTFIGVAAAPFNLHSQAIMCDTSASTPRGGLFVNCAALPVYPGIVYRITGRIIERAGETMLKSVTYRESLYVTPRSLAEFELHPSSPSMIDRIACDSTQSMLTGEDFEGQLVHFDWLRIWRADPLHERFVVGPETDPADTVGVLNLNTDTHYAYDAGRLLDLTGAVVFREGRFWIAPRGHGEVALKNPDLIMHGLPHWIFGPGQATMVGVPPADTLKITGLAGDGSDGVRIGLSPPGQSWSASIALTPGSPNGPTERLTGDVSYSAKQGDPDIDMFVCECEAVEKSRNTSTGTVTTGRDSQTDTKDVGDKVAAGGAARTKKKAGKGAIVNPGGGGPTQVDFDSDRDTTYYVECVAPPGESPMPQSFRMRIANEHPVLDAYWAANVRM